MTITRSPLRRPHRASQSIRPWHLADYALGFLLGLALGAMAIDYGRQHPTNDLPPLPQPPANAVPMHP